MRDGSPGKWLAGSANRLEIIGVIREVLLDADGQGGWSALVLAGAAIVPVLPPEMLDWHVFERGTWAWLKGTLENDKLTRMRTMHYLRAEHMERIPAPHAGERYSGPVPVAMGATNR